MAKPHFVAHAGLEFVAVLQLRLLCSVITGMCRHMWFNMSIYLCVLCPYICVHVVYAYVCKWGMCMCTLASMWMWRPEVIFRCFLAEEMWGSLKMAGCGRIGVGVAQADRGLGCAEL